MHGIFLVIALAASSQAPGSQAPAHVMTPQQKEEARRVFKEGDEAFKAGNTELALKDFLRAYELSHLGELLFDIALCERLLDHWAEARDYYERYVTEVPRGKSGELAVHQLAEVKQKLAEAEAARPPPPPDLHPASETKQAVEIPRASSPHPSVPAIVLGSVGVAAAVVAVIGLAEVLSFHGPSRPTPVAQVRSNVNQTNTWATVALITGIGAGAGLTGAILTW